MSKSFLFRMVPSFVLAALLTACGAPAVKQDIQLPAKEPGMVKAKKLAVFNVSGDHDGTFTGQIESFLANIKVSNKTYFTLVERSHLDKIMTEQKMTSSSGLFKDKDAVKLGELAGADTLIMGSVKLPRVESKSYRKPQKVCRSRNSKGECIWWGTQYQTCTDKHASVDYNLKAVSVEKGTIIFTKVYDGQTSNTHCSGGSVKTLFGGNKNVSDAEMQRDAIKIAFNKMRQDVAPYTITVSIEFMEDTSGMNDAGKTSFKQAMEFVKAKRMDRACELFQRASGQAGKHVTLLYNMGVCAEIGGDMDKAERMYEQADRSTTKPVDVIGKALNRVKERRSNKAEVESQTKR